MQYLLLIHATTTTPPSTRDWDAFFARAKSSGLFKGGSAIGKKELIGAPVAPARSEHISGFMRFDSEEKQPILDLLKHHPILLHGGAVELCEMPPDRSA